MKHPSEMSDEELIAEYKRSKLESELKNTLQGALKVLTS